MESFPNLSVCLRGLYGQIKLGLGVFPFHPYHCPAAEASAKLSAAVRDEQSCISIKWLETGLFLAICPPKVSDPIREAGQSCGPRHHLHCPNTLCFSYSAEGMLQHKTPGCNCSSWGVGGHSSTFAAAAARPGSNMEQKAGRAARGCGHLMRAQTLASVHAILSPSNTLMRHLVKRPSRSIDIPKQQQNSWQPCTKAVAYCW